MAYNPFFKDDMRDCYFDYEPVVLLRFWMSGVSIIRKKASQQVNIGLVVEEKVTVPSIPEFDSRIGKSK